MYIFFYYNNVSFQNNVEENFLIGGGSSNQSLLKIAVIMSLHALCYGIQHQDDHQYCDKNENQYNAKLQLHTEAYLESTYAYVATYSCLN